MIGMDAIAVALEPPAHGAQERLDAAARLVIEQWAQSRLEKGGAPPWPGYAPGCLVGHPPLGGLRQRRLETREDVARDGAGAEIEAERDQPLALLVGNGSVAEGQPEAA